MNPESKPWQEFARERAILADLSATREINLRELWQELVSGACQSVGAFFTEERCYLLVTMPDIGRGRPLDRRRADILEQILCGLGQKRVAIDFKVAPSTVAAHAKLALEHLGMACKPSRVHPLLMLAAKAAFDHDEGRFGSLGVIKQGGVQLRVVAIPRPERTLDGVLPPAELSVVHGLVEGETYGQMAQRRGTSRRTIANQIAAVFKRLRVSGRNELLVCLLVRDAPHTPHEPVGRQRSIRSVVRNGLPPAVNPASPSVTVAARFARTRDAEGGEGARPTELPI